VPGLAGYFAFLPLHKWSYWSKHGFTGILCLKIEKRCTCLVGNCSLQCLCIKRITEDKSTEEITSYERWQMKSNNKKQDSDSQGGFHSLNIKGKWCSSTDSRHQYWQRRQKWSNYITDTRKESVKMNGWEDDAFKKKDTDVNIFWDHGITDLEAGQLQ